MRQFRSEQLIAELVGAENAASRFGVLTRTLAGIGLETINYGVFGPAAGDLVDPEIRFLTTMRDDWMGYYYDANLAASDTHVLRLRAGKLSPYIWGESAFERLDVPEWSTAHQAVEAGLRSTLCVPLVDPTGRTPVGAINLGSSLSESEFRKIMGEHGATLMMVAHLFHTASLREVWRDRSGCLPLSERERDCLRHLVSGRRNDAIAHALGVATVTVEMHLKRARQKLRAHTTAEMVAKAILFGEIEPS